jgi:hypothetical protein
MWKSGYSLLGVMTAAIAMSACAPESTQPESAGAQDPAFARAAPATGDVVNAKLQEINAGLAAAGAHYGVDFAEISFGPNATSDKGQIIFANDRTHRLSSKWVPGDPRRLADGNNITYMNDQTFMVANGAGNAEPAIDASFATWQQVNCSKLDLVKRPYDGGFHSAIFQGGELFASDIYTLGFLPGFYFDLVLGAGASQSVLGVTFTFVFGDFDAQGNFTPSDIDNNGRTDTAIKEVWYNDAFTWTTTNTTDIDIETVALHENGHALELGHFGKVAFNTSSGKLKVSPRAVMNAFILGVLRSPLGTDNGSYCSNWASWPN